MNDTIKVLHLSTHDEECGIAIYQSNIVDGMGHEHQIYSEFFGVSPNKLKLMHGEELKKTINELLEQLKDFDILHIQHEYSFYNDDQLQQIVSGAKALSKKVLFTLHTPPHAHRINIPRSAPRGLHPRTWRHAKRVREDDEKFVASYITPLLLADLLITTSRASISSFASYGVPESLMKVIELPVPKVDKTKKTNEITENLRVQKDDVVLSTVGFIAETKGIIAALKALTYLPGTYKLAIIGGSHPSGQNDAFYDHVTDLILDLNLKSRVYITGYITDDARRDALVRETNISLYPYDRNYYDYVSSAALTNAIANDVAIVAYKTKTFLEAQADIPFINFTQSANYYELARKIQDIQLEESIQLTKKYAKQFSVENQAQLIAQQYQSLMGWQ